MIMPKGLVLPQKSNPLARRACYHKRKGCEGTQGRKLSMVSRIRGPIGMFDLPVHNSLSGSSDQLGPTSWAARSVDGALVTDDL